MAVRGRGKSDIVSTSYLQISFICLEIGGEAGLLRFKIRRERKGEHAEKQKGKEFKTQVER